MVRRLLLGLVCLLALSGGAAAAGSSNGVAGAMPALYDGELFKINFFQLSDAAAEKIIAQNQSLNTIYMCDACEGQLPGGGSFVSVLDAIQGDGFNPLWQEVQITFNSGTPRQLTSDNDIAAAADAGEITLMPTDEVYRCSVIGKP
jgi:hypothetical protein